MTKASAGDCSNTVNLIDSLVTGVKQHTSGKGTMVDWYKLSKIRVESRVMACFGCFWSFGCGHSFSMLCLQKLGSKKWIHIYLDRMEHTWLMARQRRVWKLCLELCNISALKHGLGHPSYEYSLSSVNHLLWYHPEQITSCHMMTFNSFNVLFD